MRKGGALRQSSQNRFAISALLLIGLRKAFRKASLLWIDWYEVMQLTGTAIKYGRDVDTDAIIAARYLNSSDMDELALHCMEDLDPTFTQRVKPGDIIIAGENFGCGSSREHAPSCIKAAGISCVIAKSFARIFYRNAINTGLAIMECPEAVNAISNGDVVSVDADAGTITDETTGETFTAQPFPPFLMEIINAGGLVPRWQKKLGKDA